MWVVVEMLPLQYGQSLLAQRMVELICTPMTCLFLLLPIPLQTMPLHRYGFAP